MITTLTKKPKSVMICGHEVKICYRKKLGTNLGEFHYDTETIYIKSDDNWREHLLHECLHGIIHFSGQHARLKEEIEEGLVLALENGLKSLVFC